MSDGDFEGQEMSGDDGVGSERLVPVGESIRYRRRAQAAEQKLAEVDGLLRESGEVNERLAAEVEVMKVEKKLSGSLISAGVSDLETALLVARERMASVEGDADVDSVVDAIRKEKGYLFARAESSVGSVRTLPVRDKSAGSRGVLEKVAREAAGSGSRRDVQEYMRVRRNFR